MEIKENSEWVPGHVVRVDRCKVLLSYEGWPKCWDRWFDCENRGIRVSSEQREIAEALLQVHDEGICHDCKRKPKPVKQDPVPFEKHVILPSYVLCKASEPQVKLIKSRISSLRRKYGEYSDIHITGIKDNKVRIRYLNEKSHVQTKWVNIKSIKRSLVESDERGESDESEEYRKSLAKELDRFSLLSAAGIEMRSAANPLARKTYAVRNGKSAVKAPSYTVGSCVNVLTDDGVRCKGYVVKSKGTSVRIRYTGYNAEHDTWINTHHKCLSYVSSPTKESMECVSKFQEEEFERITAEHVIGSDLLKDPTKWQINCNVCDQILITCRIFCTYCESEHNDLNGQSFDLCSECFQKRFPEAHEHPKSSFAIETLDNPVPTGRKILTDGVAIFFQEKFDKSITAASYMEKVMHINFEYKIVTVYSPSFVFERRFSEKREIMLREHSLKHNIPRCALCLGPGLDSPKKYHPDSSLTCPPPCAPFVSDYPFVVEKRKRSARDFEAVDTKRIMWIHQSCAKYSPRTYYANGSWYNILETVQLGRQIKCHLCKRRGATLGCFEERCPRSYHLHCTGRPLSDFENGVIFRCPRHTLILMTRDTYVDRYTCDICSREFKKFEEWYSCAKCADRYFSAFDVCFSCYAKLAANPGKTLSRCTDLVPVDVQSLSNASEELWRKHLRKHLSENRVENAMNNSNVNNVNNEVNNELDTSAFFLNNYRKSNAEHEARRKEALKAWDEHKSVQISKTRRSTKLRIEAQRCIYCWKLVTKNEYRNGYCGTTMCSECFLLSEKSVLPNAEPGKFSGDLGYKTNYYEYYHKYYMTRLFTENVSAELRSSESRGAAYFPVQKTKNDRNYSNMILASYEPSSNQVFSMAFHSSFYDIPGRVPRWATHSGADYHGTWIPQIVRISLLRYTSLGSRVLCNFSGRGTSAIECFLLRRNSVAVDINESSVFLAQRNVSFALTPNVNTSAEFRPLIIKGDSRKLEGPLFASESFDHILSHPPYKDCISYGNNIQGDLSQIVSEEEFQDEMQKVVMESWRLLKMHKRLTLVIGDNRKDCFYQMVGFDTIMTYINNGFVVEELIAKRQRNCRAAPLGSFLCKNYEFLMMTHEFLVILRKLPESDWEEYKRILSGAGCFCEECPWRDFRAREEFTLRRIPNFILNRKAVSMGTSWVVDATEEYSLSKLTMSKIVERYGTNDKLWMMVGFSNLFANIMASREYSPACVERFERLKEATQTNIYDKIELEKMKKCCDVLFHLGLDLDISCEGENDERHYKRMMSETHFVNQDTEESPTLVVIPSLDTPPTSVWNPCWITHYRKTLISSLKKLTGKMSSKEATIAVGVKDVRVFSSRNELRLVPLSILVANDIRNEVPEFRNKEFRLKDFIVSVPTGYSCQNKNPELAKSRYEQLLEIWELETQNEAASLEANVQYTRSFLPTVHAIYLVYTRNKPQAH